MFSHVPIALALMAVFWLLGRALGAGTKASIWLGWLAGASVCVMREITQREYQWIETQGAGRRINMPVLEGLKFWDWNAHSIGQTLIALFVSAAIAFLVSRY